MLFGKRSAALIFTMILAVASLAATPGPQATAWQSKVDSWVIATASSGITEFLVFLKDQADLSGAGQLDTKLEKGAFVYQKLTEIARRTQPAILATLQEQGVEHRSYWIANMIWVRGNADILQTLASDSRVDHIYANPQVRFAQPQIQAVSNQPAAVEWNIAKVNAPAVWAAGYAGQGAVIAGQDTGYEWTHPALKSHYRGWNGTSADHNYSWHDAIHSGGGSCGANSPQPCDDTNHGTHTMGTMVGDDGGANQIGMAPGAKWIGCRNMNQGVGSPATYSECYQWFLAPTDLNGQNPRPDLAPHVINNSWGCPPSEGCVDPNVLLSVVNAVRAAGIVTVHSAGNSGSACSSITDPAAIYDASFTIGATNSSDQIASFSSRGPVTVDGSNRLKPNVSAPGVGIRSSVPGGSYQSGWNGTSMAGPHVAGLVALMISARPNLAGHVSDIERIIEHTALPQTTTQNCGGVPGSQVPNNTFGWGRIDALAASLPSTLLDITMNKSTYVNGDNVTASGFRLKNTGSSAAAVELKVWLGVPGAAPIAILNLGPDGSFVIPAAFDHEFGPLGLFTVAGTLPRGNYEFSSRMVDPLTGFTLSEDLNPFAIQ